MSLWFNFRCEFCSVLCRVLRRALPVLQFESVLERASCGDDLAQIDCAQALFVSQLQSVSKSTSRSRKLDLESDSWPRFT